VVSLAKMVDLLIKGNRKLKRGLARAHKGVPLERRDKTGMEKGMKEPYRQRRDKPTLGACRPRLRCGRA